MMQKQNKNKRKKQNKKVSLFHLQLLNLNQLLLKKQNESEKIQGNGGLMGKVGVCKF